MKQRKTYVENQDLDVLISMIEERGFKVEDKDAANGAIGEGEEGG
jgi:hypothetical protein